VLWFIIAHRSSLRFKAVTIVLVLVVSLVGNLVGEPVFSATESPVLTEQQAPQAGPAAKNITDVFVKERLSAMVSPFQEYSMVNRFTMWRTIIEHSFWLPQGPFGWGMGSFDAHSYYFSIFSDIGYPGIFLLLVIMIRVFMIGFRVYAAEEEPRRRALIRGMIVVLFMVAFLNITGVHVGSHPADIYFWFFAGLLLTIAASRATGPLSGIALSSMIRRKG